METRMDKYQDIDIDEFQRSKKNANLYKEVYGNYGDFEDLPISENVNEIDIENFKSLIGTRNFKRKEQLEVVDSDKEKNIEIIDKVERVHDINTLLEKAKEENAKIKKEIPNRNVPNYLANLESDKNTKEIILKYDGDNDDDLPLVSSVQYATSEIDIDNSKINTASLSLDILSDLKPSGNTFISEPVSEEIKEESIEEKEFFDNKKSFTKEDFDEEDEDFIGDNGITFGKVLLIILGLASIFTAAFFIIKEYTNIF